jgi:hypothetical protein
MKPTASLVISSALRFERPLAIWPKRPIGGDMAIQRLARDPQLAAEPTDARLRLPHRRRPGAVATTSAHRSPNG